MYSMCILPRASTRIVAMDSEPIRPDKPTVSNAAWFPVYCGGSCFVYDYKKAQKVLWITVEYHVTLIQNCYTIPCRVNWT